jgi:phage/plasmid-like protein (TIGR03299 family)
MVNPTTGRVLGVFADGYRAHQYRRSLLDNLSVLLDVAGGDLHIGSVGCLGDGAQAWVQVRPAEGVHVGGDSLLPWICASSSLDGSLATTFGGSWTRWVCDNTMAMGLREPTPKFRIKHTRNSVLKVGEAREVIGIVFDHMDAVVAEAEQLMNTAVADALMAKVMDIAVGVPAADASPRAQTMNANKRAEVMGLYNHDVRVAPYRGTAWGILQAFNTHAHHMQTVRNVSRTDRQAIRTITGKVENEDRDVLAAIDRVLATV